MKPVTTPTAALPDATGKKVAIVSARFYETLADQLEDGARRAIRACGVADSNIVHITVPGCFELPLAARRAIELGRVDAVVALGVVVRGDTPHFDFVAGECARGIMTVQLATGVPIGFGVLTTNTMEQAEERADPARMDKGFEAAIAALSIATIDLEPADRRVGFRG